MFTSPIGTSLSYRPTAATGGWQRRHKLWNTRITQGNKYLDHHSEEWIGLWLLDCRQSSSYQYNRAWIKYQGLEGQRCQDNENGSGAQVCKRRQWWYYIQKNIISLYFKPFQNSACQSCHAKKIRLASVRLSACPSVYTYNTFETLIHTHPNFSHTLLSRFPRGVFLVCWNVQFQVNYGQKLVSNKINGKIWTVPVRHKQFWWK